MNARIVLVNPKHARNLAMVVRLAACYGVESVTFTGDRVRYSNGERLAVDDEGIVLPPTSTRLPREERMKGYSSVQLRRRAKPTDDVPYGTPVIGVEVMEGAQMLTSFLHPPEACYVFGPEDGSLSKGWRASCHRFVIIPTRHCLNLATAVATVLYDRLSKQDSIECITPGEWEGRGRREWFETVD